MGYDLYGKAPTAKVGKHFRRNIWFWGPLADLCLSVAPKECSPCKEWYSNDGDGLDRHEAGRLAEALELALSDGRVARYIAELRSRPDYDRREGKANETKTSFRLLIATLKHGTDFCDDVTEDDVRQFISFLKGCGGFSIC